MGKTFFIWACLFIVGFAFGARDGSEVPDDQVFDCLKDLTLKGLQCYFELSNRALKKPAQYYPKKAHGFSNSHRGGHLGNALGQLVPSDYNDWPNINTTRQRARKCMTALKNFVEPLKLVVESESRPKFHCDMSGHTLEKTLNGLLRNLENRIKDIDSYVRHKLGININPASLPVRPVNMTAMTSLAAHEMSAGVISARKAVQLRNLVLLDYLDQVVFDIKITPGSCFNTEVGIRDSCTI